MQHLILVLLIVAVATATIPSLDRNINFAGSCKDKHFREWIIPYYRGIYECAQEDGNFDLLATKLSIDLLAKTIESECVPSIFQATDIILQSTSCSDDAIVVGYEYKGRIDNVSATFLRFDIFDLVKVGDSYIATDIIPTKTDILDWFDTIMEFPSGNLLSLDNFLKWHDAEYDACTKLL